MGGRGQLSEDQPDDCASPKLAARVAAASTTAESADMAEIEVWRMPLPPPGLPAEEAKRDWASPQTTRLERLLEDRLGQIDRKLESMHQCMLKEPPVSPRKLFSSRMRRSSHDLGGESGHWLDKSDRKQSGELEAAARRLQRQSSMMSVAGTMPSCTQVEELLPHKVLKTKQATCGSLGSKKRVADSDSDSPGETGGGSPTFDVTSEAPSEGYVQATTRASRTSSMRRASLNRMLHMPNFWHKVVNRGKRVEQIWTFFEEPASSWAAMVYSNCMFMLLMGSTVIPVMQTLPEKPMTNDEFFYASTFVDILFLAELAVRWAVSPSTVGFLLGFYNLLDLAIIGPFIVRISYYESLGDNSGSNVLVEGILLCIVPVMRVIKALRSLSNFALLWPTLKEASESMTVPIFMLFIIIMVFSSALYVLEPRENVLSMPYAMWLVAVTISTVGYGDVYPMTDWGRAVTMLLIFIGLHFMAMPIAIVGAAFLETWKNRTRILCVGRMQGRLRQWGYTEEDLRMMFKSFDSDGNGELDLDEFTKMIDTMRLGLSKASVDRLFNVFDDDGSGAIDINEFVDGMGLNKQNMIRVF